jgi:hypothetical protein
MSLYDIFLIGRSAGNQASKLKGRLKQSIQDLGISAAKQVRFLNVNDVAKRNPLAPTVAATLLPLSPKDTLAVTQLIATGVPVIPLVDRLTNFTTKAPPALHKFNALEIGSGDAHLAAATSAVLEWLGLLRRQRRLFISYRRNDARHAALQLHDRLQEAGFDVFLDTHGTRPGDDFQAVLMHRLTDCEVMVLIDTPGFVNSRWTVEELARADLQSIGILQLVWPGHSPPRKSPLSEKSYLAKTDVLGPDGPLSPTAVDRIISDVERLRSRAVATRTAAIALEYRREAEAKGAKVYLGKDRLLRTDLKDGRTVVAVPAIGVPTSDRLHQVFVAAQAITSECPLLVYDHVGVLDSWLRHLDWLDAHLPVRALKVTETWKEFR